MASLSDRARRLGAIITRAQTIADSVAQRSRTVGIVAVVAAPVAWLSLFYRWAFDSLVQFLLFLVVLALLVAPGIVLVAFSKALVVASTQFDGVLDEVKTKITEGGSDVVTGVAGAVAKPGLRQFATLLGSLWKLREYRSDFASIVGKLAMTTRLLNPLFLGWVAASALGAGLVILLAVLGVVLIVV